jgi:hypothetical protein
VLPDGERRDEEHARDVAVRLPVRDQAEHLGLTRRQHARATGWCARVRNMTREVQIRTEQRQQSDLAIGVILAAALEIDRSCSTARGRQP